MGRGPGNESRGGSTKISRQDSLAVEVNLEADLKQDGPPKLVGIPDLVRAGGRIVDLGSAGKTPDSGQVAHLLDSQTTGYSVLYRYTTRRKESAVELHHLKKTKNPKLVVTGLEPATGNQRARLFRVIESYVDGLLRADSFVNISVRFAQFSSVVMHWVLLRPYLFRQLPIVSMAKKSRWEEN